MSQSGCDICHILFGEVYAGCYLGVTAKHIMSELLKAQFRQVYDITDDQFDYLMKHFTRKKFRRHEFVLKDGDPVTYDYFVVKGCLKCFALDDNGKEYILQFAVEDWWISDYKSYWNEA